MFNGMHYDPQKIENDVQKFWEINKTFQSVRKPGQLKYYCLSMLPYPSGSLHMGHVRNYTIGDILARYHRMLGKNVLHPIGWDAFGLPAENAAIQHKVSPAHWTQENIKSMKLQLKKMGFSYDWKREINTSHEDYYKWQQIFFTKLYKKGIAYKKTSDVNWCPVDKTVLANEQVLQGNCWRCDSKVENKKLSQWFLKITNYAGELAESLKKLSHWPAKVKSMQKNWIGFKKIFCVSFKLLEQQKSITIQLDQPEFLAEATYIALSTNHEYTQNILSSKTDLKKFIEECKPEKHSKILQPIGYATNIFAINPLTNKKIPIWLVNALSLKTEFNCELGIPEHNNLHKNFAKKYGIKIQKSIYPENQKKKQCDLKKEITKYLVAKKTGFFRTSCRLHDWGISRQRQWGCPIPVSYSGKKIELIPKELLPVKVSYNKIDRKIKFNGKTWCVENDTFDTFIESSWYYVRYTCPHATEMVDQKEANYWLPVDQYIGGIEHATMHLLYFRFYHKLLRDMGLLQSDEPVVKLLCQGMVVAKTFYQKSPDGKITWIPENQLKTAKTQAGQFIKITDQEGKEVKYFGIAKMSKSKKNGVDPMRIVNKYGADSLRLFIMFAAPAEMDITWNEQGIDGMVRFLKRFWLLCQKHCQKFRTNFLIDKFNEAQKELYYLLNITIEKVSQDIERHQSFNTAISHIIKIVNFLKKYPCVNQQDKILQSFSLSQITLMLYPFSPHITFVVWKNFITCGEVIDNVRWPVPDRQFMKHYKKSSTLVIQINGKVKNKILLSSQITKVELEFQVIWMERTKIILQRNSIKKIIYIPQKVVNLVF